MLAAMVELVGEQGYAPTTVAHVIARGGASRRTFYAYFSDRQSCLSEAAEDIAASWRGRVLAAIELGTQRGEDKLTAFVSALFAGTIASPAELRLLVVDLAGIGQQGVEQRQRVLSELGRLLLQDDDAGRDRTAPITQGVVDSLLAQAVVGAIVRIPYVRALRGTRMGRTKRSELLGLSADVAAWTRSCWSMPRAQIESSDAVQPTGGRAPGTLSLSAGASERRGLPPGEATLSHSFVVHNQRERLLDAVANLSSVKGYGAVSIPEIVSEAAVSVQAFYEHFAGREDALLVAYELGHRKARALVERAYEDHDDRPAAVRAAVSTLLSFLAAEPSFAHVSLLDAPGAGGKLLARASTGAAEYTELLARGVPTSTTDVRTPRVFFEASAGAVHELCCVYVASGRAHELPSLLDLASAVALTPPVR